MFSLSIIKMVQMVFLNNLIRAPVYPLQRWPYILILHQL